MNKHIVVAVLVVGLLQGPGIALSTPTSTPYLEMMPHYESIRQALLVDSMEGVSENGKAIQEQAISLLDDVAAPKPPVSEADTEILESTFAEIESAARELSAASSLASARDDFFALTKPLTRYRELSGQKETVVSESHTKKAD